MNKLVIALAFTTFCIPVHAMQEEPKHESENPMPTFLNSNTRYKLTRKDSKIDTAWSLVALLYLNS